MLHLVKPVLSDHINYIFLAVQTGGCLLLHELIQLSNKRPPANSDFHVTWMVSLFYLSVAGWFDIYLDGYCEGRASHDKVHIYLY